MCTRLDTTLKIVCDVRDLSDETLPVGTLALMVTKPTKGAATLPVSMDLKFHFQLVTGPPVACRGLFGEVRGAPGSLNHLPSCQVLCFCKVLFTVSLKTVSQILPL